MGNPHWGCLSELASFVSFVAGASHTIQKFSRYMFCNEVLLEKYLIKYSKEILATLFSTQRGSTFASRMHSSLNISYIALLLCSRNPNLVVHVLLLCQAQFGGNT